jgi:hypothetical protein
VWEDGESWGKIGTNGEVLFDRPRPTAGCSANGRRRRLLIELVVLTVVVVFVVVFSSE